MAESFMKLAMAACRRHRCRELAVLLCLCGSLNVCGQELALKSVEVDQDSAADKATSVILTFGSAPMSFPVYAMTDPQRIIIDMPDTRIMQDVKPLEPVAEFVKKIDVSTRIIDKKPNTRLEIYLKKDANYTAIISGAQIIIKLKEAQKINKTVPVFTASTVSEQNSSISGIEIRSLDKSVEVDVSFTALPQAASIYMLESPARIVMDFNNVFVDKTFEKDVGIAPVRNIAVITREDIAGYAGIIINLDKKAAFSYEQQEQWIVVSIPTEGTKFSRRGKIMLIGTGVVLAGGFVTGILINGDKQGPAGQQGQGSDLGAPPEFPDDY